MKKPEIIKFCDKTKIEIDLLDLIAQTHASKRQTRGWPLILFYNLLNIAALNSYSTFKQAYLDYQNDHDSKRRRFLSDFAECLIMPHVTCGQKISQLHIATKEAMVRCG